jgi:hypothetical protein
MIPEGAFTTDLNLALRYKIGDQKYIHPSTE